MEEGIEDFSQFFDSCNDKLLDLLSTEIEKLYSWSIGLAPSADNLPVPFVSKNDEVIWSYLKHQSKQLDTLKRKNKTIVEEFVGIREITLTDKKSEDIETEEQEDIEDEEEFDVIDEDDEEEECDLFNLKEDDLKDLDRQLKEMESDDDSIDGRKSPPKNFPKSVVDDKFFNLAEMNDYLLKSEKNIKKDEELMFEEEGFDGDVNYKYEDFFGAPEIAKQPEKRRADRVSGGTPKKVRFAMDEEEVDVEEDELEDQKNAEVENPVLLGDNVVENESGYQRRQKRLQEKIKKLEEENLAPKSWELCGEVAAQQRETNTMLEKHVEFDHSAKRAPQITEEFTDKLEELIKQRIRDKTFDNVVRVKKVDTKGPHCEATPLEEIYNKKQSLAEVYEKEYQKKVEGDAEEATVNEEHENIRKQMKELFNLIDSLTHFEYQPPQAVEEVRVVSNMASLQVEEVGIMASSEAQLIAPEEAAKKERGVIKAEEERDRTDKLRARRKKKAKQRALVDKFGEEKIFPGKNKSLKKNEEKTEKLKSSNFFNKLQETVQSEKTNGAVTKKKMIKSESSKKNSASIKL